VGYFHGKRASPTELARVELSRCFRRFGAMARMMKNNTEARDRWR
jgi:hypothetical protein